MTERKPPKVSIGIVSMTVVFTVLCLTVFSVLALSTAISERNFSEKRAAAQKSYYTAETECAKLANTIGRLWETEDEAALLSFLEENDIQYETNGAALSCSYQRSIDSGQALAVTLRLDDTLHILQWQVVSSQDWVPDQTIPVWDGENAP